MFNQGRDRFERAAKAGALAILALIAALAVISLSPAEARRFHHRAMLTGPTDPSKDAALIVDGETGKVLYARNAEAERHPASLTKMMTLYLLFDALKKGQTTLTAPLTFSSHAASQKPTNMHISAGETIKVDTAIRAIVVRSANDVAVAIAEELGGTESHFAEMMTAKARALGMRDTFFHNASGLPDPMQITTAGDLAILARHLAYDFPQYFRYFATRDFNFRGVHYVGHDNLLGRYNGADGIKTGYTAASGFNLVSSVVRNRSHIIGVVMGGRTAHRRDKEMVRLLDDTFDKVRRTPTLVAHAEVPWRTVAQNTVPYDQGAGQNFAAALPGVRGSMSDADDEDAAESRNDDEDTSDVAVTTTPTVAPRPQPAVVASYQPQSFKPPVPKPVMRTEVGEGDIGDSGTPLPLLSVHDWTIQIGAFTDLTQARAQLAAYAEKSMDILGQAQRIVVPFQSIDGQLLYRARFGPFLEREARQVCARLTERGQTCFAAISTR
ncbi:MAG: D-alanyl-D-alanine carboxypeptidase [Rhizomicrobium sp.]|jgi:D-alanyl-D-alanine carboxypeptidase